MKKIRYSLSFVLSILLVFSAFAGTNEDFNKKFSEEFDADNNTLLVIKNKFGDVNIEDWEKNQVAISVVIKVNTDSEEKANKIFNRIHITLSKNGDLINAITEIDDKLINASKFEINYSLKVPQYIKLDMSNKFGNVFINDLSGKVNLNLAYGNLMINKLLRSEEPLNEISLSYCDKANIVELAKAKIIIKYSKVEISKADELIVFSKYSKVISEKTNSIVSESAYDAYRIDEIIQFSTVGKYTNYSLNKVYDNLDVDIKYGNFRVDFISPEFKTIKSESKYCKVSLGISQNASYKIDADVEYGGIDYPDSERVSRIKDGSETTLSGIIGNKKAPKSTVTIEAKYGSVGLY